MMRRPGDTPQPQGPQSSGANGWSAGADGQAYGGFQSGTGYTGSLAPVGPVRQGRGLLVVLLAVATVAFIALATSIILLVTGGDGDSVAADPGAPAPATDSATDPATDPGATDPVEPAPTDPSDPVPATPTAPDPSSEPPPTKQPDEPKEPVDPDSPFSYTEYGDNWNFRIGDVALQATFQQGWDYDTCAPIEIDGALTDIGCVRGSEWTLRALRGKVAMTHIVLTFESPAAAKRAIKQELIAPDTFKVEPEGLLEGKSSGGTYVADFVSGQPYVVMTIETHNPRITQDRADQFTRYGTADIKGALGFRISFG